MATKRLGLIMHGITGRMGLNQHLLRSILKIRDDAGYEQTTALLREAT